MKKVLLTLLLVCMVLPMAVSAAPRSPFNGLWRGTDLDSSRIQLSIAGGGRGIFRLTWTDDNWGLCGGNPGIGRGVGSLDTGEPNILRTD